MKTLGKSTSHRVIQLGVLSAGKVKPRQLRSSCEMDVFFTFLNQVILGNTSTQFVDWNARYCKKRLNGLHCTPTGEQSQHSEKNCSFCLTNSRGVNLWHSTTSARNGCKFKTMRLSKQTNKWNDGSKCIHQSNMAMENYPFGCFPRSKPSFAENFPAGHDYRSVATGHQAPPFLVPPRHSQRFHIPGVCRACRSEDTPMPKRLHFQHEATKMGAVWV